MCSPDLEQLQKKLAEARRAKVKEISELGAKLEKEIAEGFAEV